MAVSRSDETVQKVVDEVLEYFEKNDPESFQKLNADHSKKDELIAEIRHIAECEISHGEELKCNGNDVTKLNLPPGRLAAIEDGLKMATYRVEVGCEEAKLTFVDGSDFTTIQFDGQENRDNAYYMQLASIIIEGILLGLSAVGSKVSPSKAVIKKTSTKIVKSLMGSAELQKAAKKFLEEWNGLIVVEAKAVALSHLLIATNDCISLLDIIGSLCSEMTWWDWTIAAANFIAQIIAASATGGAAFIAKIALSLESANDFNQKVLNLNLLQMKSPIQYV